MRQTKRERYISHIASGGDVLPTNRHPVDELAGIRAKIVPLKAREAEIRAAILSGECDRRGDHFMAVMRVAETVRIDTKACRFALGDELLEPWLRRGHTTYVLIRPKRRKSSK